MRQLCVALALSAAGVLAVAVPAMASGAIIRVPEPGSLSLLAVGAGGGWLISRYLRRK